jgi:arsenate reductase
MAEGLLRELASDRFEAFSAGTQPKGLSPITVQVMEEIGIDVSNHRAKSIEELQDRSFDYVITVCDVARKICPSVTGAAALHWNISDPAELEQKGIDSTEAFRSAEGQNRRFHRRRRINLAQASARPWERVRPRS